jgi:hypothetical protein
MAEPLTDLMEACFEDNPADRPKDAAAVAEQLVKLLAEPNRRGRWPRRVRRGRRGARRREVISSGTLVSSGTSVPEETAEALREHLEPRPPRS